MKRCAVHKKTIFSVIIAVLLALVLVICCLPKSKKASAYDGTFYFRNDPVISATATGGRYPIRFNLIVSESALLSGSEITITLSSNSSSAYIQRGHENTTLTETETTSQSVAFPKSAITWSSDGMASLYVDMFLNVYEKGRLTATCASTSAVSDEHTVVSAIEIAARDGYREQGGLTSFSACSLAKLYDKYVGKDLTNTGAFEIVSNMGFSSYTDTTPYVTADVYIPSSVMGLLSSSDNASIDVNVKDNFLTGATYGDHYSVKGKYYALSTGTFYSDPDEYEMNRWGLVGVDTGWRNFGSKTTVGAWQSATYSEISNNYIRSRVLSDISYVTGISNGYLYNVKQNTFSVGEGIKNLSFIAELNRSGDAPVYFMAEVLEFSFDVNYVYLENTNQVLTMWQDYDIKPVYRTNIVKTTPREMSENIFTNNPTLTTTERNALQTFGGISSSETRPLEVIYTMSSTSGNFETKSHTYDIALINIYNKYSAIQAMYNLSGINDISHFNVVSTRQTYDASSGLIYDMGDEILRQALDYEYVYDKDEGKAYATVLYSEFLYKDFSIVIESNDLTDPLQINYYTADVEVKDGRVTLKYNYADIEEDLLNSNNWIFELSADDFEVTGDSDMLIAVDIGDEELTVTIPEKYQSDLFGLRISAMIEIIPDVPYAFVYKYYTDFKVSGDGRTLTPIMGQSTSEPTLLSTLKRYNTYANFMKDHRAEVYAPIDEFEDAYGAVYATPKGVMMTSDKETETCTLTVLYDLHSLFVVHDNLTDNFTFVQASHSTTTYDAETFVEACGGDKDGYRVDKLTSPSAGVKINNKYDYHEATVVLNADTYSGDVYVINVVYTDKWLIRINYMEQFKATPFVVKAMYNGEILVKDYEDIYALTSADLAAILGRSSMGIINNKSTVDTITVSYDGIGTYTVDTTYSYMAIKKKNYNGDIEGELQVPLTCYAEWCEGYGKDWSILYLNTAGNTWFQFSNDVRRDELYGFFSVAIFEEKVSDLNFHFKNYVMDGAVTFHEFEEVRGTKVYKFFDGFRKSGEMFYSLVGKVGMAFCEIDNDENAIYYSNFFYLDGTSANAVVSGSGSTDLNDKDGAAVNKLQGVVNDIANWWENFKENSGLSTVEQILAIAIPAILVIALVAGVIWFLRWLFKKRD